MVSFHSTKDHKRNWNGVVYYSQVLEKIPGRPHGGVGGQSRVQRECRTRAHAFIRVYRWSAGQIGQFKPKEWGFVSSTEVLCRGI